MDRNRHSRFVACVVTFIVALGLLPPSARADDIAYRYDELGRVVQANNATTGEAILYSYDAAGNITSQRTVSLATLSIGHFSPARGPVGTQVTINGTGFSATPASNTVRFNGETAAVVSATTTQIVAMVPAAATSGAISVEVASVTVTSSVAFTVLAGSTEPTITLVMPNVGRAGTPITIVGNNFETVPSRNSVRLNSNPATVTASSAMTISTVIPAATGSGRIRVTTPNGSAVSPSDFIIVPPDYSAQHIITTGRMETDGTATELTYPVAWRFNLRLFEGKVGDLLTVGITSMNIGALTIKVYAPNATMVAYGVVTAAGQGVQIPKLTESGTYAVVLDGTGNTGNASFAIFKPVTDTVTVGGASSTLTLTPPGRRGLVTFSGVQGDYVSVTLSGVTLSAGRVAVISPTGAEVVASSLTTSGAVLQPRLPRTGAYTVLLDPTGSVGGSVTVAVANTSAASLTANSGTISLNLSSSSPVPHTFRGEAGAYMSIAALVQGPTNFGASVTVRNPDGSVLATKTPTAGYPGSPNWSGSRVVNFGPLLSSGTYSVVVQRTGSVTGTAQLTLTSAATGTLTANGATVDVPISLAGQSVVRSFNASAGQSLSFAVGERTGFIRGASITVLHPDGSVLHSNTFSPPVGDGGVIGGAPDAYRDGGKVVNLGPMPATGAYKLVLQQSDSQRVEDTYVGTLKLTLAEPLTGVISVDGASVSRDITVVGQGLKYTFEGAAGQYVALGMSSNAGTITAATAVVLDPAGAPVASGSMVVTTSGVTVITTFGSAVVNMGPLAASGTYTLLIQQAGSKALSTGAIDLTLSTPLAASLGTGGASSNVEVERPGQGVLYTFSGTAGDYLSFHASVHGWITSATTTVLTASGASLATGSLTTTPFYAMSGPGGGSAIGGYEGTSVVNFGPLPATATYSILFQQTGAGGANTGPLTATLATPLTGSFPPNSSTSNIGVTQAGRSVLYTFNANAGDYRSVFISETNGLIKSATVTVLNPQGGSVGTGALSTTASGSAPNVTYSGRVLLNVGPLPTSGAYSVLVQQTGSGAGETGTLAVTFSEPASGTLTIGAPANVTVSWPGQSILYDFAGADGQLLSLDVSEPGSHISSATVRILNPGGSRLKSGTLSATLCPSCGNTYNGSMTLTSGALPGTATYRVLVQQATIASTSPSVGTGQLTLALTDLAPTSGSSTNISTSTPGQRAVINFSASIGESIGMAMTSAALTPASPTSYTLYLYQPNGTQLESVACSTANSGCQLVVRNLPATGTYRAEVGAAATQTISGTLTISSAAKAALTAGAPYNLSLSTIGQPAALSFIAGAGEPLALNISGLSTTPAGVTHYVAVYNAAGTGIAGASAIGAGLTFNLPNLPAGNYSVWIYSQYPATSSMQVRLQPREGGTLPNGVSTHFSAPTNGQYAYFDFAATAGETVAIALTNVALTPSSPSNYMFYVYKPDGLALDWGNCSAGGAGCLMHKRQLPMTGTYRVEVRPNGHNAISGTITVSKAVTGALSSGAPYNLNLGELGQTALLTFAVEAGDSVALNIENLVTTPANYAVTVSVINPAGATLPQGGAVGAGTTVNLTNLAAGTYTAWIGPQSPSTSSMQVTLHPGIRAPVEEGVSANFSTPARGQLAQFLFSGTAGESIGVALTNLVLTPSGTQNITLYVYRPDGGALEWTNCFTSSPGCELPYPKLPQSGTYLVEVRPPGHRALSGTVTVTKGAQHPLTLGTPVNLSLSPVGKPAVLTFSAVPSQTVALEVSGTTTVPANTTLGLKLYGPSGGEVWQTTWWLSSATTTINLPYLATGAYAVWIWPLYPATSTLQVTLHPGVGGLLQDGVPANFSATAPVQNAYFEFDANAGDPVGVALNNVTFSPSTNAQHTLYLYPPSGSALTWTNCVQGTGCVVRHRSLPVTGRYKIDVNVHPNWSTRISGTLTASKGVTGTLTAGAPQLINLTPTGRPALLTFTLPAAQTVSMAFSSIGTTPVGRSVGAEIVNAAGATVASGSSTTGFTLNTGTLAAGVYSVWMYPLSPSTASVTVGF